MKWVKCQVLRSRCVCFFQNSQSCDKGWGLLLNKDLCREISEVFISEKYEN